MTRILFYVLVLYLGYRFFRSMVNARTSSETRDTAAPPQEAELEKDPQCGAYFLKINGVRAVVGGKELFFCSRQCRDQYRKEHR